MSRIKIELEKVLKERKISKNQLCYACKLQHTQLNNYCKNKVVRVDLATIAKIWIMWDAVLQIYLCWRRMKNREKR